MKLNNKRPTNKNKWESFAQSDPLWYIYTEFDGDVNKFWESGKKGCQKILHKTKPFIKKYGVVVEIGCGVGRCLIPMSSHFKKGIGVDISKTMLSNLNKFSKERKINHKMKSYLDEELWYENKANLVYSVIVFQHIEDFKIIEDYIKKISICLVNGGVAYLHFDTRPKTIDYCMINILPDIILPKQWRSGIKRIRRNRAMLMTIFQRYDLSVVMEQNSNSENNIFVLQKADL